MAITPQQKTAINTQLSVNLSTVTDDRLIELCLLYRSAPSVRPAFVAALDAEITRRFTPAYIAANDVMFSVIQNFSNQFNPELQYKEKLYQFVNATNRELWMTENISFFEATLEITSRVEWLLNDSAVFNAVFESPLASNKLLNSSVAMTAVTASTTVMTRIAASSVAMSAVVASSLAMTTIIASTTAMSAVVASSLAMTTIIASTTAMTVLASSSVAMTTIIASSTAMTAVTASSVALSAIVKSTAARNALMSSNTVFQNNRVAIYNTVKARWTKQAGVADSPAQNAPMSTVNAAVASPAGFVFASLGYYNNGALSNITHPDGTLAAAKGTSYSPTTLANLDAVSFNGATFKGTVSQAYAYAELWIPPAI